MLVEVMGMEVQGLIGKCSKARCLYMKDAILILQWTFGKDELAACDNQPLAFIESRRHDNVGDAGLVFHRQEDKAHGCAGSLPSDDAARRPYKLDRKSTRLN